MRANRQPSGSARSAIGHRFGTLQLRELLATRGDAGLWLADDDSGGATLLRLYPGLPTLDEWHKLELAASQLLYVADSRLVRIKEIALDIWPRLSFACPDAESLSQRIARAPMAPEAAVAMCADVTGALAALARAGVPAVDVSPADVVLVGERARLLADVGLPGGKVAHACVDLDHAAPERAAAIAERALGVSAARPGGAAATPQSMTYALASIVTAAIHGPQPAGVAQPARLAQVLRRGLAHSPSERYASPAALTEALGHAIDLDLPQQGGRAPRATRARQPRAAAAPRPTGPERRRIGIALPAVAAAMLAAAAIGGTVAGSATTEPEPPAVVTLAGAGLSVEAPQGWVRAGAAEVPPALCGVSFFSHPLGRPGATALVLTRAAAPLLARLADAAHTPVRLGDHDAWRYRDVGLGAGRVGDVYLLEDDDGPLVAACVGPSGTSTSMRAACSAALTTLRPDAGQTAPLGGEAAARNGLTRVVEELDRARASERRALAGAATARRQAAAAERLAAAYAHAAEGAARSGRVGAPGDLGRLVDRLEETGRAYAGLATAARATRRTTYAQARERIDAHERRLRADLAALAFSSAGA